MSLQDRAAVKASLLNAIAQEPSSGVCKMEADVIAYIAQIEVPDEPWPQLLPWLNHRCTAADVKHKITGLRVLTALLERIGA